MFEITNNTLLAENISRIQFRAPRIAKKRKPGQFIIVRLYDGGERVPLTIVEGDSEGGTVDIIVQAVGKNTQLLCEKKVGEAILDVVGPLGKPTELETFGTCVVVGGGVGIAPLYPIAKGLKEAGNTIITILGARNKSLIILEDELRAMSSDMIVTTDDGSYGKKGLVTNALRSLIDNGTAIDFVVAVGPVVMMEAITQVTRECNIKTVVSLNPIMIDGTGMCGGCRCLIDGEVKFACVDGPEFDGHTVDFANLKQRLRMFTKQERHLHTGEGGCHLNE